MSYVNLSSTHIGDNDLVELDGMSDVDVLDLSGTNVTDAGLGHLKRLSRLQILILDGTHVTAAGIADLRQALPGLAIVASRRCTCVRQDRTGNRGYGVGVLPAAQYAEGLSVLRPS
jgi:hypothetical protein